MTDRKARRFAPGGASFGARPIGLSFGAGFQTAVDMSGPIPGQHLGYVGFVAAFLDPDLLGTPLQRGFAILWRDGIGIDQLLGETRLGEYQCRN
jgi:hypothetical protein